MVLRAPALILVRRLILVHTDKMKIAYIFNLKSAIISQQASYAQERYIFNPSDSGLPNLKVLRGQYLVT